MTFDEATGKATIIVESNGWVELKISNLNYVEDEDVPSIEETPEEEEFPGKEEEEEEVVLENAALNKSVTGSHADTDADHPYSKVTDGTTTCGDYDYANFGDVNEAVWAQIDLGEARDISEIQMWRYNRDARQDKDTVILLSESGDFTDQVNTLVIWNSNESKETTWPNGVGEEGTHTLPVGSDPLYPENEATGGKSFLVYGDNVQWLNGNKDGVPTAENNTFAARYVRVYMNGNSLGGESNHLIEVKVMAIAQEEPQEPEEGVIIDNLAQGKTVTGAPESSNNFVRVVDNNRNCQAGTYYETENTWEGWKDHNGAVWAQIDLGKVRDVSEVKMWRYFTDFRAYNDTVILLSPDENFADNTTLVIWNSNGNGGNDNDGAFWSNSQGSDETHTFNKGQDPLYIETSDGKTFPVYGENVAWKNGSQEGVPTEENNTFKARYVRVYMNGNTQYTNATMETVKENGKGASNHLIEVQVMGIVELEDTDVPEQVTGIEAVERGTTSAMIGFLPSMDNMGVKCYEMNWGKTGEKPQVTELNQTRYKLTGLESGAEYTVSIVAVDYFGNKSEPATYVFKTYEEDDFVVKASVASGKYEETQNVTLSAGADGEIWYTLDGTEPFDEDGNPSASAKKYNSGNEVVISKSGSLHAAVKPGDNVWPTSAFFYLIGGEEVMDFEAPEAPVNVTVTETSARGAIIRWNSGADADIAAFNVYVDGEKVSSQNVTRMAATQTAITDLTPGTAYQVYVTAVDEAGNESLRSKTVEFVTRLQ